MKMQDIDKRIGMPDIDREWARFETEVIDQRPRRVWTPARVAAAVAVAFSLSAAAGVWFTFSENSETSEYSEISTDTIATPAFFVFDNVEMQAIADTLSRFYGVDPVFQSEGTKRLRLYVKVEKGESIENVVELLNNFKKIDITLQDGKLIIK